MTAPKPPNRRPELALLCAAALCAAMVACRKGGVQTAPSAVEIATAQNARTVQRVLYYPAGEDALLAECRVLMPASEQVQADMSALLKRYLAGPPGAGQFLAFPERSDLRAVFLVDGLAVVDLTGPVRSGGGSSTETARVYGIVQTLQSNFPEVNGVRILVDGLEVDTLMGHLDLSRPLVQEPRLLARQAAPPAQGDAP